MISFLFTAGREQLDSTLGIFLEIYIYIYLKGCILFELNSIALKFIHIGFLSRQRQSIRKRKVQSVPNATISPFSRKIRKEETENLLLLLFFPPLSNFFFQSCRNLNKPPPPSLLVFKRTDKEQEFLKNSRPHRAIIALPDHRYLR